MVYEDIVEQKCYTFKTFAYSFVPTINCLNKLELLNT